jgi:hypothetical protein
MAVKLNLAAGSVLGSKIVTVLLSLDAVCSYLLEIRISHFGYAIFRRIGPLPQNSGAKSTSANAISCSVNGRYKLRKII